MFKKAFLMCALASTVFAATSIPRDYYPPIFPRLLKHHQAAGTRSLAAGPANALSKSAAMDWKKIGSIRYSNTDYSGTGTTWKFLGRDTVEYNPLGYVVMTKASSAVSGWSLDSLNWLDSCVYANGSVIEEIQKDFTSGSVIWGFRITYAPSTDGKFMVTYDYNWDTLKNTWVPLSRDSLILSGPYANFITGDFSAIERMFAWTFDTALADWKFSGDYARVESECSPTTVVLAGTGSLYGSDSIASQKIIYTFNSSVKMMKTLTGETLQILDSVSGAYKDYWGLFYTYDQNGFQTSQRYASFDSVTMVMQDSYKYSMFPDAYGNDTLELDCDYTPVTASTGIWDTIIDDRYARLYDANGNNVSIIASDFYPWDSTWHVQTKDTVFFAQVNSKVLHGPTPGISPDVVIRKTPASIRFSAPGISGLRLYDLSGRLVASMSQKPGASIELVFASHNAKITTGAYVARLMIGDKERSFKVLTGL
jgi:hypothetical protein